MGPLKEQAEHALHAAREGLEERGHHAYDAAHDAAVNYRDEAGDRLSSAANVISTLVKGIGIAATLSRAVKRFSDFRGIPWYRPRSSTLSSVGIFAAGACVGAGAALLLTPISGPELRTKLLKQGEIAKQKAMRAIDSVATQASAAFSGQRSSGQQSSGQQAVGQKSNPKSDGKVDNGIRQQSNP